MMGLDPHSSEDPPCKDRKRPEICDVLQLLKQLEIVHKKGQIRPEAVTRRETKLGVELGDTGGDELSCLKLFLKP